MIGLGIEGTIFAESGLGRAVSLARGAGASAVAVLLLAPDSCITIRRVSFHCVSPISAPTTVKSQRRNGPIAERRQSRPRGIPATASVTDKRYSGILAHTSLSVDMFAPCFRTLTAVSNC